VQEREKKSSMGKNRVTTQKVWYNTIIKH
jgi:hypothetical protein